MKNEKKSMHDTSKSLAIVGSAPTLKMAPYDDPNFEIWVHSTAIPAPDMKRADFAFEVHPRRYWGMPNVTERLTSFGNPVYMQDHTDEIPNSIPYPREAVRKEFLLPCMNDVLYVTNAIAWMILLGIHEGFSDINLFGVHMAHETEYGYQQPSCSWALGIAQGRGCSIWVPKESSLLKARYEYGFDEPSKYMTLLEDRIVGLREGVSQTKKQLESIAMQRAKTEGALTEAQHWYDFIAGHK